MGLAQREFICSLVFGEYGSFERSSCLWCLAMEWSREKCLQLIDEFERQSILWDPTNGTYYNKVKKHDAWVAIANNMGCTASDAKKKMESLLSSFRREKAKGTKSIGTGKGREEIYLTKWFAFPRMAFLLDRDKPRNTIDSDTIDDSVQENGNAEPNFESVIVDNATTELEATTSQDTEESEAQAPAGAVNPLASKPSTSATREKQCQKRKRPDEPIVTSKIDQALSFLKNATNNNELKGDECGVYGQHVAHKLRSYSKKTRAIVQHHINNIIFSADMGQYDIAEARSAYQPFNAPQYSNPSLPIQISVPRSSPHSQTYSHQPSPNIVPIPSPSPQSQTYSHQPSPNIVPIPSPSPQSQTYSHQPSPNIVPIPSPSPQSQTYSHQPSPNIVPIPSPSPQLQTSYSNQPSPNIIPPPNQTYVNDINEHFFD